jgi:MFS family permease
LMAIVIAIFSGFAPTLLGGGRTGEDGFILLGFLLLGISYGQAAGAVTSNFAAKYRYIGAALSTDLAWLIGAAFAPVVVLYLSTRFGLEYVSVYLLSGSLGTLVALGVNRRLEKRATEI